MTEYELISLYHEAIALFFTATTLITSLLFAYLVAMFFMAHRLGIVLFSILNILYVAVCFAQSGALLANGNRAALLGQEILARATEPGSSIGFLAESLYIPINMPSAMTWFVRVAVLLSLLYAFLHRRMQKNATEDALP